MKIVADANIIAIENSFRRFGDLDLIPGRSIKKADLFDADALFVRSITRVDQTLLEGTAVKFVATASSGVDHIDLDYLAGKGIGFADAKGSNANAVVDYCFAAIAFALLEQKFPIAEIEVGIIGGGKVGGLFADKLAGMGIAHRIYDPFLQQNGAFCQSLDEVMKCKIVSLHVPLTHSGDYPTDKFISGNRLELLPAGAVLINTCRGSVVDERALFGLLSDRADITTIFDVWKNEPDIDLGLAARVDIATPHIAGYSQPAKQAATELLLLAFQEYFFGADSSREPASTLPESAAGNAVVSVGINRSSELPDWATLLDILPLTELSRDFKQSLNSGIGRFGFDEIRNKLRQRLEFRNYSIAAQQLSPSSLKLFATMGFSIV